MYRLFFFITSYLFVESLFAQNSSITLNIAKIKNNIEEKMRLGGADRFSPKVNVFYIPTFGFIIKIDDNSNQIEYRQFQLDDFKSKPIPNNTKNKKKLPNPQDELLLKTQKSIVLDNNYDDTKIRNLILESMDIVDLEALQSIRIMYFQSQIDTLGLQKQDTKGKLIIRQKVYWELSKKEFDLFKNGSYSKDDILKKIQKVIPPMEDTKIMLGQQIFGAIPDNVIQTITKEDPIQYTSTLQHHYFQNLGIYYIHHFDFSEDSFMYSENKKQSFNENLALFQTKIENLGKEYLMYYSHILLPQLKVNENVTWYMQFKMNENSIKHIENSPKTVNFITISIHQSTIELYHSKKISLEDAIKQIKISKY